MADRQRVNKVMTQPIVQLFKFLQNKTRVQIWLYENTTTKLEGRIIGFDEYMNVVLDDAEEVDAKKRSRTELGRLLLKGDTITLVMQAPDTSGAAA
ncbi:snr-6 [Symbiodinium sp. KB8]|nr:snr-6 [Symbiodinium sp. KB8]